MSLVRSLAFAALVGTSLARAGEPAKWPLPLIEGQLSGDITVPRFPDMPALHWKVVARNETAKAERIFSVEIEGKGTRARGEMHVSPAGEVTWHLADAQLDVALWRTALEPVLGSALAGINVTGALRLAGDGAWKGGRNTARLQFELRDATMQNPQGTWSISGIAARGAIAWPQLVTESPVRATFHEAAASGVVAQNGAIEFELGGNRTLRLIEAQCRLMDGRVALEPFTVALDQPDVKTQLHFSAVQLGGLAKFVPKMLTDARGPVSGTLDVSWTHADGLVFANGALQPRGAEVASVRLSPSPGFFTSHLPARLRERIDLLPKWLGPVHDWFTPKNPAYDTLRAIEMGQMPLQVQTVQVHVQPQGDANGRSARIVITAKPAAADSVVDTVHFEINVTGPLADFVRMALQGRLSVHLGK